MRYELKGKIIKIYDTKQVSEKFSKREFAVEVEDGKYPQQVLLQATGDRIALLDGMNVGDEVVAVWNLRGRAWQDKFFNSLDIWKLERTSAASTGAGTASESSDELPF